MSRQDWKPLSLSNHVMVRPGELWETYFLDSKFHVMSTWPTSGYLGCFVEIVCFSGADVFGWPVYDKWLLFVFVWVYRIVNIGSIGMSGVRVSREIRPSVWWVWRDWVTWWIRGLGKMSYFFSILQLCKDLYFVLFLLWGVRVEVSSWHPLSQQSPPNLVVRPLRKPTKAFSSQEDRVP